MKNKSYKFPVETPVDKNFDMNHDGKLNISESYLRDDYLDKLKENDNKSHLSNSPKYNDKAIGIGIFGIIIIIIAVIKLIKLLL